MAYDFKRLADVDAAAEVQDTDSVLIVQDGEVKKTAKGNVGGAGGYIYAPEPGDFGTTTITIDESNTTEVNTISTNYDELLKTLEAGGVAWIRFPGEPRCSMICGWYYGNASESPTGSAAVRILTFDDTYLLTNGTYVPNL